MTAITISRQFGSLGCEVARAAAALLNYRVVWRELINTAAQRAGAPTLALHAIDELGLLGLKPSPEEEQAYQTALKQVVTELADEGSIVIVGRAGQAILHGRLDVLHVRVMAPLELRIDRVAWRQGIHRQAARAQVLASDRSRKIFLQKMYGLKWDDSQLYHLVINTALFQPEQAAVLIAAAIQSLPGNFATTQSPDDCID